MNFNSPLLPSVIVASSSESRLASLESLAVAVAMIVATFRFADTLDKSL